MVMVSLRFIGALVNNTKNAFWMDLDAFFFALKLVPIIDLSRTSLEEFNIIQKEYK